MKQAQFLDVVSEQVARQRFAEVFGALEARAESVPLCEALDRVLFEDVLAPVDVPGFDRSNVDGFAVRAGDTFGAQEEAPVELRIGAVKVAAGSAAPEGFELAPGTAVSIATGAVLPRGADAVVMVEDTAPAAREGFVDVLRASAPGERIAGAGTDLARGETVLRRGTRLSSRETGLLAAIGVAKVCAFRRPRVAILSTGDEVRPPGTALGVGEVFDSNGRILFDASSEQGAAPVALGIAADDKERLVAMVREALTGERACDVLLLSGGTSKGAGDLNGEVVAQLSAELPGSSGIRVHGVALKPGKPLCLAGVAGKPVVILPGFPTSAIFTFHDFVAEHLRRLAGLGTSTPATTEAVAPLRIASTPGRTEYCLVDLVPGAAGLAAYPLGSGSGSVSTFSRADGFVRIDAPTEFVPAGARVVVRPLSEQIRPADLVAIGSHCIGLDRLLSKMAALGYATKSIPVGSLAGLQALARGEGDVAGTHLLDPDSDHYNAAFLPEGVGILGGYGRRQGFVFREGDPRFAGKDLAELRTAVFEPGTRMVNRNRGSGTRVLLDRFLAVGASEAPEGFGTEVRSHHAVAAAVAQGRADWGFTLDSLCDASGLAFTFVREERFELAVRNDRRERAAVRRLAQLLEDESMLDELRNLGLIP